MSFSEELFREKYHNNENYPVALNKYTINYDKNLDLKFLVLEFMNLEKANLNEFTFTISEHDSSGKLIKASKFNQSDLNLEHKKKHISNFKYKITNNTKSISYQLVSAKFTDKEYLEGNFVSGNIYEYENRVSVYSYKKWLYPFLIPILTVSMFLVLLANKSYLEGEKYLNNNDKFSYTLSNNQVTITSYNHLERELVIPETIDGYLVVGIGKRAFEYSNLTKVKIDANDISIGDDAFRNSRYLTEVSGGRLSEIGKNAFSNLTLLKKFSFNSIDLIKDNAFKNNIRLRSLNVDNIENTKFTSLALNGVRLKGFYKSNDFLVYNNTLLEAPVRNNSLVINEEISFNKVSNELKNDFNDIKTLVILNDKFVLKKDLFLLFPNLENLEISSGVRLSNNVFEYLSLNIKHVAIPIYGRSFNDLFKDISNYYITELTIIDLNDVYTDNYIDGSLDYIGRVITK